MTVFEAVEQELERLGGDLAGSALAAMALKLAEELDKPGNSATSKAMCNRELRENLGRLRELAPPAKEATKLDGIRAGLTLVGGTGA